MNVLLANYNTRGEPISIGDPVIFCYATEIQRRQYKADFFKFVLSYDLNKLHDDKQFSHLNKENWLPTISELVKIPLLFNTCSGVEIAPEVAGDYRGYTFYDMWKNTIQDYEIIQIPFTKAYSHTIEKIKTIFGNDYITINLRKNSRWGQHRNADLMKWKELINNNHTKPFLFVGDHKNNFPELTFCENLVWIKDEFHTNLFEDFLIVDSAALHIGSSSGINTSRMLQNKLSVAVNWDGQPEWYGPKSTVDDNETTVGGRDQFKMIREFNSNTVNKYIERVYHG